MEPLNGSFMSQNPQMLVSYDPQQLLKQGHEKETPRPKSILINRRDGPHQVIKTVSLVNHRMFLSMMTVLVVISVMNLAAALWIAKVLQLDSVSKQKQSY